MSGMQIIYVCGNKNKEREKTEWEMETQIFNVLNRVELGQQLEL